MNRILIVDDDPFLLEGIRRLTGRSFDTVVATSGIEGLLKLRENGPFAAVVSDMNMRGMSGVEFLEQAKDIAPKTPRVMFTGYANPQTMSDAINRACVFRFMEKPATPEEFKKCLNDCVDAYHAARETPLAHAELRRDGNWIRDALKSVNYDNEFELRFQPRINTESGAALGAEVLLRWMPQSGGEIPPSAFIPIAEKTGHIREITLWVLLNACRTWASWVKQDDQDLAISVNISPALFEQTNMVEMVRMVLTRTGMDPRRLELEITEGIELTPDETVKRTITGLRGLGVRLAIDDFGTGFASMNYLQQLDVDCVKVDRAFVKNAPNSRRDQAILKALRSLTQDLGMTMVAEGIETEEHETFLRGLGVTELQGYRFSKPLPNEEFRNWTKEHGVDGQPAGPRLHVVRKAAE